jgi:hypothetical protein
MRAVLLSALLATGGVQPARGGPLDTPPMLPTRAASCEDECRAESARYHASCADMGESARLLCELNVRAHLDVCLRYCED